MRAAVLIACLLAACTGATGRAAAPIAASDADVARFFDQSMTATMEDLAIPGGALAVLRDGRPILVRGYGMADVAAGVPVDPETTLFRAASISKLLPWILVLQLVERGALDLDRDVNAYLDFALPAPHGSPITLRHLMTHSAGFAERFHGVFDPDLETPLGTTLRENIPDMVHAPGEVVAYSNYGAALAGYVVERAYGMPWAQVVQERVFAPLGMLRSTVAQPVPDALAGSLAATYHHGDPRPGPFRVTPLAPMGSLSATPRDMARLLGMLMAGGTGEHGRVLQADSVAAMLALQRPLGTGLADGMGLGLLVGEYRGVRYAGHAGNMSTLATDMELLPGLGLGWYYVFNSQGPNEQARQVRERLLRAVIERFAPDLASPPQARLPSTASEVAGRYLSTRRIHSGPLMFSGLMNTTDVEEDGEGGLKIASSGQVTRWLPAGPDRFVERTSGIALAAGRDASGNVVRIASGALYPAAEFERAPLLTTLVPPIALVAGGALLAWALLAPVQLAMRSWRRRAGALPTGAVPPHPAATRLLRWTGAARLLVLLVPIAWGAFGLALAMDFAVLFTVPAAIRVALGLASLLTGPAALILAATAWIRLRQPGVAWDQRLSSVLLALAALALAFLCYALRMPDFSADW